MSFFRSASGRTQTRTLEMAVSMESWGGAEGNAGRLVFGKLQRTPGEPPPYIQHPALGTYIMILSSPHPSAEPPLGHLNPGGPFHWLMRSTPALFPAPTGNALTLPTGPQCLREGRRINFTVTCSALLSYFIFTTTPLFPSSR